MKPLLVGEANPYQTDPRLAQRYALYPDPPNCAGWRLCHTIMQLEEDEYLRRFDRVNLCDGKWGIKEARARAEELSKSHDVIVFLGAKVSKAFDCKFEPFWVSQRFTINGVLSPQRRVMLPHPSGLSRVWNEPGAYERARVALREAGLL